MVTIFYSDLVNFSELYTDSSPMEVGEGNIVVFVCYSGVGVDGDDAELLLQDIRGEYEQVPGVQGELCQRQSHDRVRLATPGDGPPRWSDSQHGSVYPG